MDIIRVQNLTKTYGNFTAVNNISFSVEKGTMLGFLGINGAGKTTVINMLATLLAPDSGHVEICGEELGKDDERIRRKIGIVYQQNCLGAGKPDLQRDHPRGVKGTGEGTVCAARRNFKAGRYYEEEIPDALRRTKAPVRDCRGTDAHARNIVFG